MHTTQSLSRAERAADFFAEQEFKRQQRDLLPDVIAPRGPEVHPALLQCRLFSVGQIGTADLLENDAGQRMYVNARLIETGYAKNQQYIEYDGVQLTKDHLRVLIALLDLGSGLSPEEWVEFHPRAFAKERLDWSPSAYSVKKIKRALRDMRGAQITYRWGQDATAKTLTLINQIEVDAARKVVRVQFHPTVLEMFRGFPTYLPSSEMRKLRGGVETWVWGFVRSVPKNCDRAFETAWLYRMSGASTCMSLTEFSRDLGRALERLVEIGVLKSYSRVMGEVRFKRR